VKKVIIINGSGGIGKDEFVEAVSKYTNVVNCDSVKIIKDMATLAGCDGKKTEKDRKFLSDLKALVMAYNDMPFRYVSNSIDNFLRFDFNIKNALIFLHIREPKEIKRVVDKYGAITVLIRNKKVKKIESNDSDANVENYDYDFIIENNTSLIDLEEKARTFLEVVADKELFRLAMNTTCVNYVEKDRVVRRNRR